MQSNVHKKFPIELEGQTTEFKCHVCDISGEADLPYKPVEERELTRGDFAELDQEDINESE